MQSAQANQGRDFTLKLNFWLKETTLKQKQKNSIKMETEQANPGWFTLTQMHTFQFSQNASDRLMQLCPFYISEMRPLLHLQPDLLRCGDAVKGKWGCPVLHGAPCACRGQQGYNMWGVRDTSTQGFTAGARYVTHSACFETCFSKFGLNECA